MVLNLRKYIDKVIFFLFYINIFNYDGTSNDYGSLAKKIIYAAVFGNLAKKDYLRLTSTLSPTITVE